MKPLGWVFLISCWTLITALVLYSFGKILRDK